MKAEDLTQKVNVQMSYEEAEKLWAALEETDFNDPIIQQLVDLLDEYINT